MLFKKLLTDYLTFGKRDRVGLAIVITIIAGSFLVPRLFKKPPHLLPLKENKVLAEAIDTLNQRKLRSGTSRYNNDPDNFERSSFIEPTNEPPFTDKPLFRFNPNSITAADWQRLGLSSRLSRTIEKYVSKGGKFYKPEDLKKIWGMPEGFYLRVKDFVDLPAAASRYTKTYDTQPYVRQERTYASVDANSADTSAFIDLPGIGSKLSARIIAFRQKLGGFYSVEQVGETFGLPDSTFQKIKGRLQVDGAAVRKINVNTATKEELKTHPYIRWNLANVIVEYRNQHGPFKNLEDLKNIALIDETTFNKITHYLSL